MRDREREERREKERERESHDCSSLGDSELCFITYDSDKRPYYHDSSHNHYTVPQWRLPAQVSRERERDRKEKCVAK